MFEKNALQPKGEGAVTRKKTEWLKGHPVGSYLFAGKALCNFAISGAGPLQATVVEVLRTTQGQIPVIILHGGDETMEGLSAKLWQEQFDNGDHNGARFRVCRDGSFEPFLGMDPMEILELLKDLAREEGYTLTARFRRVLDAHIRILELLECPCCLTGFAFLCGIRDMTEFQGNVMELPCSRGEQQRILSDLGLTDEGQEEQFQIFRDLIQVLAHQAKSAGWTPDRSVGSLNIIQAVKENATMLLSVDVQRMPQLMKYLCRELLICRQQPFFLLLDQVDLEDSGLTELLQAPAKFRFGLLTENLVQMVGEEALPLVAEKLHRLVLFKHGMDTTAETLARLIGQEEVEKTSVSKGSDKKFLGWTPDRTSKTVTTSKEKEFRVETRDITDLAPGRAIVFDALSDRIVKV